MLTKSGILLVKKLALQSHNSSKNIFNTVVISIDGILQKQQYGHSLKHDVTIAQCCIEPIILHKFHNFKGHHRTIHTFKAIGRSYWWPKLCLDVEKYINKCDMCQKSTKHGKLPT